MKNKQLSTDEDGFLVQSQDWTEDWAKQCALQDQLELSEQHWRVLGFLREYWDEFQMAPSMRLLVKALRARLGEDCGSSRFVYRLFPEGAPQACRYAGLPRPTSCI